MAKRRKIDKANEPDASIILPRLKHLSFIESLSELALPDDQMPITEPFVGDLVIAYAFDLPNMLQMLNQADLAELDLRREMLFPLAVENLSAQTMNVDFSGAPPVLYLRVGNDLEACTMLIQDIWQEVAAKVPGEVVVAAPARDTLIVTSSESAEGLTQVLKLSEQAREHAGQHALSQFLYAWRDQKWQLFGPPG